MRKTVALTLLALAAACGRDRHAPEPSTPPADSAPAAQAGAARTRAACEAEAARASSADEQGVLRQSCRGLPEH